MQIKQLNIANFRNLSEQSIELSPKINVFIGENGVGKTSLLEAIHFLSVGRSFRTHLIKRVIQYEKENFVVHAKIEDTEQEEHRLGITKDQQGNSKIKHNDVVIDSIAEMADCLPVILLNTDSFDLIHAGPKQRRQFLDWGLFHVEHSFLSIWKSYQRIIKQRNVLLKQQAGRADLLSWDLQLAKYGEEYHQLREKYTKDLLPYFFEIVKEFNLPEPVSITYSQGWSEGPLIEALQSAYIDDYRFGYTRYGPHKADLNFKYGNSSVEHHYSRGQQKLFILALMLAQLKMLCQLTEKKPLVLIDDLSAELDKHAITHLIKAVEQGNVQAIITAIDKDVMHYFNDYNVKLFHVERGEVRAI